MTPNPFDQPTPLPAPVSPTNAACAPIDPILATRLARLNDRRPAEPRVASRASIADPATAGPRRHPADKSRLAALTISVATTVGLSVYFARTATPTISTATPRTTATAEVTKSPTTIASATAAPNAKTAGVTVAPATSVRASVPTVAPAIVTTAATAPATNGQAVAGETAEMKFGPIQVSITVANGQITSVETLQQPSDRKSLRINEQALPVLADEVLTGQTAVVQTVSGATYTSGAYKQSLQSAIDTARAQGLLA
jgi:uncharacterized protein with FMN-binding domain